MKERHEALGPMTFHEISVFVCFVTVIVLWFFRRPLFMPGTQFLNEYMQLKWDFNDKYINTRNIVNIWYPLLRMGRSIQIQDRTWHGDIGGKCNTGNTYGTCGFRSTFQTSILAISGRAHNLLFHLA